MTMFKERSSLLMDRRKLQSMLKLINTKIRDSLRLQAEWSIAERERFDKITMKAVDEATRTSEEKVAEMSASVLELKREKMHALGKAKIFLQRAESAEKDKDLLETRIESLEISLSSLHDHTQELKMQKGIVCRLLCKHEAVLQDVIALSTVLSSSYLHAHNGVVTSETSWGEDAKKHVHDGEHGAQGRISIWYAVCAKAIGTGTQALWRFRVAVVAVIAANRVRRLAGFPYLTATSFSHLSPSAVSSIGDASWKHIPLVSLLGSGLDDLQNRNPVTKAMPIVASDSVNEEREQELVHQRRPLVDLSKILPGSAYRTRSKMIFSLPVTVVRRCVLSLTQCLRSTSRHLFYTKAKLDETKSLNETLSMQHSTLRDTLANKENVISILESRIEKLNSEALQSVVGLGNLSSISLAVTKLSFRCAVRTKACRTMLSL